MPVIIGGSPSTGSSLLRQMLNRHSKVYCGPESQLFAYPVLFSNWEKSKKQLLNSGALSSPDFWLMRGVNLVGSEQGCTEESLISCVANSSTFSEFCETYFNLALSKYNKRIWAEKTPSNVLTFGSFLNTWDDGIALHIVRDPKDVVTSLMERGLSLFEAAGRYIFNTSHGLITCEHERNVAIKYEDLVSSTELALAPFLELIGLQYEKAMIAEGNPNMTDPVQMPGWKSSEIIAPNSKSIGRFDDLPLEKQGEIRGALHLIRISEKYAQAHGIVHRDIVEISDETGYTFSPNSTSQNKEQLNVLRKQMNQYRRRCILERRLFFEQARPIELIAN